MKKILSWVVVVFFAILALGALPSVAGFFLLAAAALMLPLNKLQNFISGWLPKKWMKVTIVLVLFILAMVLIPSPSPDPDRDDPDTETVQPSENEQPPTPSVPAEPEPEPEP
ncbi:MAG: hypothetical protein J6R04_08175, partial [Clostridia bacterium]|nr:hypothetical protein [Clostridia bacterium]